MTDHQPDEPEHDHEVPEPLGPADEQGDDATGFADLGLRPELLSTLTRLGYEEPTPIQRETIPLLLEGRDLLGQAATGTGKTAAFALPILERIQKGGRTVPVALILVPTRELAVQVSEALYRYGRELDAQVLPIYGGQPIGRQLQALRRGVHVVVATPGRALDHIGRGTLPLDEVEMVVLDEADEMLDMGFAEDIEAILEATPDDRQTVLFSATMPPRIERIIRRHLKDPARIQIGLGHPVAGEAPLVRQIAYVVARSHKAAALGRVLDVESPGSAIVFCRTRIEVDQLTETLNGRGYRAQALHGGMSQDQRDRVMSRLRNQTADLLVATDVAARGLDIDQLTHVINYDVPSAPESYVHRIGRVGRAGREGVAITLAEPREQRLLGNIERVTKQKIAIAKVPTVADLRARQMEQTMTMLRESLQSDDLDPYRPYLDTLTAEFDAREVALAAIKLVHQAGSGAGDEQEIPEVAVRKDHDKKKGYDKKGYEKKAWDKKGHSDGAKHGDKGDRYRGETATLYIGLGASSGVRPKDLVGAIANETRLSGRDIGPIKITERFALVGVPDNAIDEVIDAMKRTTIKGKKTTVRRDSDKKG
jgi:ATP-dependent RNA helicase DeaD